MTYRLKSKFPGTNFARWDPGHDEYPLTCPDCGIELLNHPPELAAHKRTHIPSPTPWEERILRFMEDKKRDPRLAVEIERLTGFDWEVFSEQEFVQHEFLRKEGLSIETADA